MAPAPGNIALLGSTGSIGRSTLALVRQHPERFRVVALAARRDIETLLHQAAEFRPEFVAVADADAAAEVRKRIGGGIQVRGGEEAVLEAATWPSAHTVVAAVVGYAGLSSVLAAIAEGKHIALANKESLVAGGEVVRRALRQRPVKLVPVDSEHSSIFQLLEGRSGGLRRIVLTASGGPFLGRDAASLHDVSPAEATKHPRWQMGAKISVDSATLMNKGLEVIEAHWLFELPPEKIDVVIHPQSLVHGCVEFEDGALLAALGPNDMRIPISYALGYLYSEDPLNDPGPRVDNQVGFLDLIREGRLEFSAPDTAKFPALTLCYEALRQGGTATAVLNAANEVAVQAFLDRQVKFTAIAEIVRETLGGYASRPVSSLDDVIAADSWGRETASKMKHRFPSSSLTGA